MIRGGAAADRDLDAILEEEQGPRNRIGSLIADRYRVIRPIGTGGVGTVYLAQDQLSELHVAIKVLHRELHYLPEMVARFEREALAASRIEHPNVASATAFGRLPDGSCYLVLELIEGMSLSEVLSREGALPVRRALEIARQVAAGLSAAHRDGIVHRDLKPDNIMLMRAGTSLDRVKVVDFGIAHVPAESGTPSASPRGNIFGTPDYMAPEQAAGTIVDHRADLYTLGIVLYEMLSGRAPFRGGDMHAVLQLQMTAAPAPLPETIDPGTSRLVMQLLAKDPDLRPPTAEEVCRRIDVELDPEAVSSGNSRPPPPTARPRSVPSSSRPSHDSQRALDSAPASVHNPPASSQRLKLGTVELPTWLLAVAVAAPLGLTVAVVLVATRPPPPEPAPIAAVQPLSEVQLDALAHRASGGNTEALEQLEQNPPVTAAQWAAIGRGHAHLGATSRSVRAYAHALEMDPRWGENESLVRDLYRAAEQRVELDLILELAVHQLGERGPDLIYDIWARAKSDPSSTLLAKETNRLLHTAAVRDGASPSLLVTLDLWDARTCEEYRSLLPRARTHADRRSSHVLRRLTREVGCGEDLQADCFPCLRGSSALQAALESAEQRPRPRL